MIAQWSGCAGVPCVAIVNAVYLVGVCHGPISMFNSALVLEIKRDTANMFLFLYLEPTGQVAR